MFEISIFCVIVFAMSYWAALFIMGRRDDVLHGEFVEAEPEPVATASRVTFPVPVAPPAPVPVARQQPAPPPVTAAVSPSPLPKLPPANTEALQSLLVSLKQELKNAAKI